MRQSSSIDRCVIALALLASAPCAGRVARAQVEAGATAEPHPAAVPETDPHAVAAPDAAAGAEPVVAYPLFVPKARLIAGAELRKVHPESEQIAEDNRQPFFLERARIYLDVALNDDVTGSFSAELDADPVIRDAYVNLKLKRWFQITAGHFKRPISRIELTSTGKLPFRDRGIFNRILLRQAEWGNRSLGAMLWGKVRSADLEWSVAVMNAAPSVDVKELEQIRGVDVLGRLEYSPGKTFSIAVNGGYKNTEPYLNGPNLSLYAFGGDAQLRVGGLRLVLESMLAQNPRPPTPPPVMGRTPFAYVVTGYAAYDIRPAPWIALQPVVAGEWVDTDGEVKGDEAVRGVLGFNFLFWEDRLHVMPQVEVVRPLGEVGPRSEVKRETYYLLLSTEF
jgi:hypothetical protein